MSRRTAMPGRAVLLGAGAVLLLLLIVLVRSCGSDTLSAGELRTQAAEICATATRQTDRVAVPNAPAGGARFLAEGVAYMRPAVAQLSALKPPDDLRDRYERAVALGEQQVELISRAEAAIRDDGEVIAGFRRLQQELAPLVEDENALWKALGVSACVRR